MRHLPIRYVRHLITPFIMLPLFYAAATPSDFDISPPRCRHYYA